MSRRHNPPRNPGRTSFFVDGYEGDRGYDAKEHAQIRPPFVVLKATQGTHHVDLEHATRCQESHAAGLAVGHYHFAEPGISPVVQSQHFWETVREHFLTRWPAGWGHNAAPKAHTDFLIVDYETGEGRDAAKWLAEFERALWKAGTLIGYLPLGMLREHPEIKLASNLYWVPDYPRFPIGIGAKRVLWAHQFTSEARVRGWANPVDYSHITSRSSRGYWEAQ